MLTGELWLTMSVMIFCATFTQALTGFGFGLIAVPLLLFVLPSQQALLAGMLLSMMSSSLQGFRMRHLARWDLIVRLLLLSTPGMVVGVALSEYMDKLYIKGVVGVILIGYVSFQWLQFKGETKEKKGNESTQGTEPVEKMEKGPRPKAEDLEGLTGEGNPSERGEGLRTFSKEFVLVAFSSGLLNGLAAIPGPPIVALLIKHLKKDTFQATTVNFFFLQYAVTAASKIVLFKGNFSISFGVLLASMVLAIIIGYWVGQPIRKRINEVQFKKLVYGLLFLIGITSLWEPFFVLFIKQHSFFRFWVF